jgi:small subunit ribosomal protein S17
MPRKNNEELEAEGSGAEIAAEEVLGEEISIQTSDEDVEAVAEETPKKTRSAEAGDAATSDDAQANETKGETSIVDSLLSTVSTVVGNVAEAVTSGVSAVVSVVTPGAAATTETDKSHHSKRAEKIGIVQSDKMTKTVTVRVDRVVKHPVYRKYIKRRKKFMAHDELGSTIGDKVRIVETRPLSARKRWRVVEIVQKAEK